MKISAIILARGGSKGIPNKNIISFCGHPLLAWTIMQLKVSSCIDEIWVSSDCENILQVAKKYGAKQILRPIELSGDNVSSELGWRHAIEIIQNQTAEMPDYILAPQVTSPLRNAYDFKNATDLIINSNSDTLFSAVEVEDFFLWEKNSDKSYKSINYDYRERKPRQQINKKFLENGSIYIFKTSHFLLKNNRLGGNMSVYIMPKYKMFQIDNHDDINLCEAIMKYYKLDVIA